MIIVTFLIPIILIAGIMAVVMLLFKSGQRRGFYLGGKMKWILGGYTAVLLIAAVLSAIILPAKLTTGKTYSTEQMEKIQDEETRVFDEAMNGKYDPGRTAYTKKKSWSIPFSERTLTVSAPSVSVFVEHTDNSKDGSIEAVYYTGKFIIERIDVTDKSNPVELSLAGSDLSVNNPIPTEVNMGLFQAGFAFSQFSDGTGGMSFDSEATFGLGFVYLKVPAGVEVKGDVTYVN
jgi:hypothetical protein